MENHINIQPSPSGGAVPLWNRNYIRVWAANYMIFFSFMIVMPLLPLYLNEEFGAGKHTIGVILSGYTVTALFARVFSGYIVDTFPRRTVLLFSYALFSFFFLGYLIGGSLLLFAIVRTLHGAPFGTTTVANSTVAIDVLHPSHRAEGIGYYGLSNNLATAVAPSIGLFIYEAIGNYQLIFFIAFLMSFLGLVINSTVQFRKKEEESNQKNPQEVNVVSGVTNVDNENYDTNDTNVTKETNNIPSRRLMRLDRFFLIHGWSEGLMLACLSFSYGVLSTYLAIYGKETMGITSGTGMFFLILSCGLMVSRLTGGRSLRKGRVVRNATLGMSISVFSYLLFAAVHNPWGYYGCAVILGLGNGHMFPAVQTMFVNLAPHNRRGTANSTMLTSWDVGIGAGVVFGGIVAELKGYQAAFWMASIVNALGVLFYFLYVRKNYLRNRLR